MFKGIINKIKENPDFQELRRSSVKDFVDGSIFTKQFIRRQYKLLLLLVVFSVFYIDNRYASERQQLYGLDLEKKIQDAKYLSLTISAELMEITRQSNVLKMVEEAGLGLKQPLDPPIVLKADVEPDK